MLAKAGKAKATANPRAERGKQIAQAGGIKHVGGARYLVPSQSGGAAYEVDLADGRCQCPDWQFHRSACKHIEATYLTIAWSASVDADGTVTETLTVTKVKRPTYPRNWPAYNAASVEQKRHARVLLRELCDTIDEPPHAGAGPKPFPLRDLIYGMVTKVYVGTDGRSAQTDIEDNRDRGFVRRAGCYNVYFKYMQFPSVTAILTRLIEQSAAPLAIIERAGQVAIDSTGFSTVGYVRYFDHKHGKMKSRHPFTKLHAMVGCLTNVVTAVEVSDAGDCTALPALLAQTRKNFRVLEVSADKAYASKDNIALIYACGAEPFVAMKDNAVMDPKSPEWSRALAKSLLFREEWLARYGRRQHVEATFGAIKANFGGALRSRSSQAKVNEVLIKVLCHNLWCVTRAVHEHGLEPSFSAGDAIAAVQS